MNNIQSTISTEYNLGIFQNEVLIKVFKNNTADFQLYESSENEEINESEERIVSQIAKYGYLETTDGTSIVFYEVRLQPNVLIERNRVTVGNIIRRLMYGNSAAFVNFVYADDHRPDWRFTFIHKAEVFDEAKDDFVKHETEAKRYTYLLGPNESCRTAADRLQTLSRKDEIKIEDIEQAFSVEALSKEFFEKYKQHYEKFVDYITTSQSLLSHFYDSDREKQARDFVKKLMGRIVFLYFIQKKGWLGVAENKKWGTGNQNFMSDLFNNSAQDALFYVNYLEPLFFETLNKKRDNDICTINGKTLGRVPFLNGGLFEREFKNGHLLTFPADYFKNLFSFFDSYNFTIIENDPQNRNVAVDPEMLGHIFENLLEDNKDKGAYYTPKEIVHYMCQESLIEYLNTKISENSENSELSESSRTNLEQFIKHKRDNDFVRQNAETINTALREVKVCDPAIGSGAFPVGLLMEIYTAKQALNEISGDVNGQTAAEIKQHIIQNSIYGVDIERGAVDIARLRFWLSLIIEETEPQALPNLDYKIMQGNSLVPMYEGEVLEINWKINIGNALKESQPETAGKLENYKETLNQLSKKQKEYFNPNTNKKKAKQEIRDLKIEFLSIMIEVERIKLRESGINPDFTSNRKKAKEATERKIKYEGLGQSLAKLKRLKETDKPLNYFDWKLDFADVLNPQIAKQTGFDIVIGNPPWVSMKGKHGIAESKRNNLSLLMEKYNGNSYMPNLFEFFIYSSLILLKKESILTMIIPDRMGFNIAFKDLRKQLLNNYLLLNIVYKWKFETVIADTMTFILKNKKRDQYYFGIKTRQNNPNILINKNDVLKSEYYEFRGFDNSTIKQLVSKVVENCEPLTTFCKSTSGFGGRSKEITNHRVSNVQMEVCKGKSIKRYGSVEILYFHFVDKNLTGRTRDTTKLGKQEKVLLRKTGSELIATYDNNSIYPEQSLYFLYDFKIDALYLLALINSKLINWFYQNRFVTNEDSTPQLKNYDLDAFPIIDLSGDDIKLNNFSLIVNQILALKKEHKDTTALEREIDKMVYELFGLTQEEIEIVEESVKK